METPGVSHGRENNYRALYSYAGTPSRRICTPRASSKGRSDRSNESTVPAGISPRFGGELGSSRELEAGERARFIIAKSYFKVRHTFLELTGDGEGRAR